MGEEDPGWIPCTTKGCPGDGRYASPGRGHVAVCPYPKPYDGDPLPEFQEHDPMMQALPAFMTLLYLFGDAVKGANRDERKALYDARLMLKQKKPLRDVAQAILDARGPHWTPSPETMEAIEAINRKED
jgi:hypothetical protein